MIYKNNNTHFSQIHLQAMEDETDSIYGINYQILKNRLKKYGWKELLKHLIYKKQKNFAKKKLRDKKKNK